MQQVREIARLFGSDRADLFMALGTAMGELPPTIAPPAEDYPRARTLLSRLGWVYDPRYAP